MVRRCTKPYHSAYKRYGAKGITVCERWMVFENFLSDMGERPEGTTIDRINGNLGYEPGNCRWATIKDQQRNTKANRMVTFDGLTMCISEWAEKLGISKDTLSYRIERGWGDRAFTEPPRLGNRVISHITPRQDTNAFQTSYAFQDPAK